MNILLNIKGNSGLEYHRQIMPNDALMRIQPDYNPHYTMDLLQVLENEMRQFDAVVILREAFGINTGEVKFNSQQEQIDWYTDKGRQNYGKEMLLIKKLKELGIKIIFDIDDYWRVPQDHGMAKLMKWGMVEERTKHFLRNSDLITTTTQTFANRIKEVTNVPIQILPNCINPNDKQWQSYHIPSKKIRFGWIGGVYHNKDIKIMEYSLAMFNRDFKDAQIVYGGFSAKKIVVGERDITKLHPQNVPHFNNEKVFSTNYQYLSKEYRTWLDEVTTVQEHLYYDEPYRRLHGQQVDRYASMYNELDICLVPLVEDDFNKYKSELKLIEAGHMNKACIVSDVKPYTGFPEDCVIFINKHDNKKGWYKAMKDLYNNPGKIKYYADNLTKYVNENYNIDKHSEVRYNAYKSILNK